MKSCMYELLIMFLIIFAPPIIYLFHSAQCQHYYEYPNYLTDSLLLPRYNCHYFLIESQLSGYFSSTVVS